LVPILAALLTFRASTGAATPIPPTNDLPLRPVIVDTDLGEDDLMALAWLLRAPSLDVVAVTVSGTGLSHCDPGVDNLRALLELMDATGPAVGCGPEQPLPGGTLFPDEWRAAADQLSGVRLPPAADAGALSAAAVSVISDQLLAETVPVTILTLGPLTTMAEVLAADPRLVSDIAEVVTMGGALDVPGNVIPEGATALGRSEWNLHVDPAADAVVLASGVPLTLVALDATQDAPMTGEIAAALAADTAAPGAWLADQLVRHDPFLLSGDFYLWDPLAAGAVIDRSLVSVADERLSVETQGPDAGRLDRDDAGNAVRVATGADTGRFADAFLAGLRAGAPARAP
jgi:pyrimidine-specific ribonucleoside hydrolase